MFLACIDPWINKDWPILTDHLLVKDSRTVRVLENGQKPHPLQFAAHFSHQFRQIELSRVSEAQSAWFEVRFAKRARSP